MQRGPFPTGSSFMPRSEGRRQGPKNQRVAETQLMHPALGGQELSPLHRPGCAPRCSPGGGDPLFVFLFFNLGLKFPPEQRCLQPGRTRSRSVPSPRSQTPGAPHNLPPSCLDTLRGAQDPPSKTNCSLFHAADPPDPFQLRGSSEQRCLGRRA